MSQLKLNISLESFIFWTAYILLFIIGGFLAFNGLPFRPFMAIFIVIPFITFLRIKIDKIFFLYVLLMIEILISALINGSGITKPLLFSRYLIISYASYLVAYNYLGPSLKENIFKISLIIGLIQLPIVTIQKLFYDQIMLFSRVDISYWDIGFGTFFIKNDSAMSIFLIGLILILLFNNNISVKFKIIKVYVLIATIFISGSRVLQLTTLVILAVYYLQGFSIKKIFYVFLFAILGLVIVSQTKFSKEIKEQIALAYVQATFQESGSMEAFKLGEYSRNAAVLYYLNQPLKWFGDGPGAYFDVTEREYVLGNRGQIFSFYSEVGIIGLILSYMILFQISRNCTNRKIANLYFFSICMLSITSDILSDAGIILAYSIFLVPVINNDDKTDEI